MNKKEQNNAKPNNKENNNATQKHTKPTTTNKEKQIKQYEKPNKPTQAK